MSNPQQPQYPPQRPQPQSQEWPADYRRQTPPKKKTHWAGWVGLVLGILGLVFGWVPVLGWPALIGAILGLIFSVVGFMGAKGVPIAGLIACVLALIFGFTANDAALGGRDVSAAGAGGAVGSALAPAKTEFSAGETADIEGLQITVAVPKQVRGTGGPYLCADVNYVNNSQEERSYNGGFDWKLQDPDNVIALATIRFGGTDKSLKSGSLAPGGKVAGEVCFNAPATKGSIKIMNEETFGGTTATWVAKTS